MMQMLGVLEGDDLGPAGIDAKLGRRGIRISQQAGLVSGIAPGMGDDAGTLGRRFMIPFLDLAADLIGGQHALFDQQAANGILAPLPHPDRMVLLMRMGLMGMRMVVIAMIMVMALMLGIMCHGGPPLFGCRSPAPATAQRYRPGCCRRRRLGNSAR